MSEVSAQFPRPLLSWRKLDEDHQGEGKLTFLRAAIICIFCFQSRKVQFQFSNYRNRFGKSEVLVTAWFCAVLSPSSYSSEFQRIAQELSKRGNKKCDHEICHYPASLVNPKPPLSLEKSRATRPKGTTGNSTKHIPCLTWATFNQPATLIFELSNL